MLKNLSEDYQYERFENVLGLYIRFTINRRVVKSHLLDNSIKSFVFDVLLDHKFPFQQPQIMCRTPFSSPPLNDGRDLCNDILKSDWKIAKKLYEIVQYIPDFISEVLITEEEMKVYGHFHLEYIYNLNDWSPNGINQESKIFECQEQDEQNQELYYHRYLVITKSAFLLFKQMKEMENMGQLLSWATLQSLDKLRRNLNRPDLVSFVWRHIDGKQPWVLNLMISQHEECIGYLVNNMQNMGVGVEKNIKNQTKIKESEVTKEKIAQMDIEQIQEHIAIYEEAMQTDLSLSNIQTLTTLYQQAIEYFSAFDNVMFNDILNRMQSLLQREDVQVVMNSYGEDQKQTEQSTNQEQDKQQEENKKSNIDFNVGEDQEDKAEEDKKEEKEQQQQSQDKKKIFQIGSDEEEEDKQESEDDQEYLDSDEDENQKDKNKDQQKTENQKETSNQDNKDQEQEKESQEVKNNYQHNEESQQNEESMAYKEQESENRENQDSECQDNQKEETNQEVNKEQEIKQDQEKNEENQQEKDNENNEQEKKDEHQEENKDNEQDNEKTDNQEKNEETNKEISQDQQEQKNE